MIARSISDVRYTTRRLAPMVAIVSLHQRSPSGIATLGEAKYLVKRQDSIA
jgi:hypothetical protein